MIGKTLGPYRLVAKLGEGGMGEVYRARDVRLDRDVALKILPAGFGRDPDRVRRFEREARAVAALSDTHIVAVYDVGQDDGILYYAAELVEGADLRALLNADRLPLKKTLELATQIASGLAAAHDKGIVHRDLKPENVLVSQGGLAKIADFGLAKVTQRGGDSDLPAAASTVTAAGIVMGTVAYMSPEQAAGRDVDVRSDQFSFGSMLYEMVTGRPAFKRATAAETLTAILREEPEPIVEKASAVPSPLVWILERCLAKTPDDRYGSTRDLVKDLERVKAGFSAASAGAVTTPSRPGAWRTVAGLLIATAAIAVSYTLTSRRAPAEPAQVLRTNIDLPDGVELATFEERLGATLALSPDGRDLVVVGERNHLSALYMRPLDRADAQVIAGTEGARGPFFSPDGQWIGFWADGHLKRIPRAGGVATVICDAPTENGATWTSDDVILFSTGVGLLQVSADGGQPEPLTTPDAPKNEYAHKWPVALPGTKAVLFSIEYIGAGPQGTSVGLLSLDTRRWVSVVPGAGHPRFVAPGFILVNRGGTLQAAPFDLAHLSVAGAFTAIEEGASRAGAGAIQSYDVSATGQRLVYVASSQAWQDRALYAVDLHGKTELLTDLRKGYWSPALSPDGGKLAVNLWINPQVSEIWVLDLARRTWQRLTSGSNDWEPVWKGSETLVYVRGQGGSAAWNEYSLSAIGTGGPTLLVRYPHQIASHAVAPDRRTVVFTTLGTSSFDLWTQPVDLNATARPLLVTPADEQTLTPSFSPDGRWLAYTSNTTGRTEVYVMDFPGGAARYSVSTLGGSYPCWSRDGRQIFYWQGQTMMAASVRPGSPFAVDSPHALFTVSFVPFLGFDVASDGSRFYMIGSESSHVVSPIVFVSDLSEDLRSVSRVR